MKTIECVCIFIGIAIACAVVSLITHPHVKREAVVKPLYQPTHGNEWLKQVTPKFSEPSWLFDIWVNTHGTQQLPDGNLLSFDLLTGEGIYINTKTHAGQLVRTQLPTN